MWLAFFKSNCWYVGKSSALLLVFWLFCQSATEEGRRASKGGGEEIISSHVGVVISVPLTDILAACWKVVLDSIIDEYGWFFLIQMSMDDWLG